MHILSKNRRPENRRGSAFVEFILTFPMLFFFLLGAVDMGFYCYALIAVQDAARTVALFASSATGNGNSSGACQLLLDNLSSLPNHPTTCSSSLVASWTDPNGQPGVKVTVSYTTIQLIPFYSVPSHLTITRTVYARSRS